MARSSERLSARTVQTARSPGLYADGKGLYFRVSRTGGRSWIYRYAAEYRVHDMGLGPYPDISLAEARQKALECRKLRLEGSDPLKTRRTARYEAQSDEAKRITFTACAERYIASHKAGWRNS